MNRAYKLLLAVVTMLPLAWTCYLAVVLVQFLLLALRQRGPMDLDNLPFTMELLPVHLGVAVVHLVETGLLFLHAARNPRLGKDARVGWLLAIGLASMLAVPAYFWWQIWREPAPGAADPQGLSG